MYKPRRKHDLESLIRTIIFLYFELKLPPGISEGDTNTLARKSISFWSIVDNKIKLHSKEAQTYWKQTLEITRGEDLNDRMQQLEYQLLKLQFNFLDNDSIFSEFEEMFPETLTTQ